MLDLVSREGSRLISPLSLERLNAPDLPDKKSGQMPADNSEPGVVDLNRIHTARAHSVILNNNERTVGQKRRFSEADNINNNVDNESDYQKYYENMYSTNNL